MKRLRIKKNSHEKMRRVSALLLVFSLCLFAGCADKTAEQTAETTASEEYTVEAVPETTDASEKIVQIETQHCTLQHSGVYSELLHNEVIEEEISVEIFSMQNGESETELFRIYFGGEQMGESIGVLNTENGAINVSYTICSYEEDFFTDEQTMERYYMLMDALSEILTAIQNDPRFAAPGSMVFTEKQNVQLAHWNVVLLKNMGYDETAGDDRYQVTFYGVINDERVDLYSISIGSPEFENALGFYMLDETVSALSLHNYDLPVKDTWTEDNLNEIYTMLDTMNDVIQVIVSDENYRTDKGTE